VDFAWLLQYMSLANAMSRAIELGHANIRFFYLKKSLGKVPI
jgi:hypothetical protein